MNKQEIIELIQKLDDEKILNFIYGLLIKEKGDN